MGWGEQIWTLAWCLTQCAFCFPLGGAGVPFIITWPQNEAALNLSKQQTRCQWRIWVTANPSYSLPKSGCSIGDWANFLMLCSIKNRRVILIFPCLKTDEQDPRYSLNTSFSSYWVQDPTRQALWAEWSQQKPATLGFTFQSQRRPIQKAGEWSFVWAL